MSAGTGIMHSEFNASSSEPFHSFQIWVYPKKLDISPRHEAYHYKPEDKLNQVLLTLSPDRRYETAIINQDAFFSVCKLENSKSVDYKINLEKNGVYIHCAQGSAQIENYILNAGDALGLYELDSISIKAIETSELIFVEVPMARGVKV